MFKQRKGKWVFTQIIEEMNSIISFNKLSCFEKIQFFFYYREKCDLINKCIKKF